MATSTLAIAKFGPDEIRAAIAQHDSDSADAVVQVGTNMRMARLAAAAEWWLGKPVLHVNTVMAWEAMRSSGIEDRVPGFGSLLADH
jgi:maleate isomerase